MNDDQHRYLSYLLRIWAVDQNGSRIWRASLESSTTGERLGFPDLDTLLAFLRQRTSGTSEPDAGNSASVSVQSSEGAS
ncbi:MAG: hypothetical protein JXA14_15770 [Anaerolineae bacterium]|nr:hypothetical protein [Anaerolineae bacterium]